MRTAKVEMVEATLAKDAGGRTVAGSPRKLGMFQVRGTSLDDLRDAAKVEAKRRLPGRDVAVSFADQNGERIVITTREQR